jgi:hypothetical protein
VLVGIDTEADDQWSAAGREKNEVRNAERLPELQALCDGFGVRRRTSSPTRWRRARRAARSCASCSAAGHCEIGTHLHPWSSPPFRPEDLRAHTYPMNLPRELLERQLTELTSVIEERVGVRPTSYRAGRNGFDGHSLPILERLGYTVDTSVDPLFNERRKGGPAFAGAPLVPYHPDYSDVRRPGASKILEVPISAATLPACPSRSRRSTRRCRPIPYRGRPQAPGAAARVAAPVVLAAAGHARLRRRGCGTARAVLQHHLSLERAAARRQPLHTRRGERRPLPGGPAAAARALVGRLGAVGRTYREFAAAYAVVNVLMVTPHLPPHQAANALFPHLLGEALRERGHLVRYLTFGERRGRRRRPLRPAPARPAPDAPAARRSRPGTLAEGRASGSGSPTSCTSTRAPG